MPSCFIVNRADSGEVILYCTGDRENRSIYNASYYLRTYAHLVINGVKWCEHSDGCNIYLWSDTWLVVVFYLWSDMGLKTRPREPT